MYVVPLLRKLTERLRQTEYRRLFGAMLAGKVLGVVLAIVVMKVVANYLFTPAFADDTPPPTPAYVNPLNTMWTVMAAFLVFFMQAGFMMLEAGFARTRETVNVLLEGIVDTCLCGILFWAWGFAFMFGAGNGFIGHQYFFLQGDPRDLREHRGRLPRLLALPVRLRRHLQHDHLRRHGRPHGVRGRPALQHWRQRVHLSRSSATGRGAPTGGSPPFTRSRSTTSPARRSSTRSAASSPSPGAIALGPRIGRKFKRDGGVPMPGHDMTIAAVGGVILWFGWYGFNPGSTLSAMDAAGCGRVAANTTLAACGGGLSALAFMYPRNKTWDCGITVNGFLAGLVAITCPCYWVSPGGAILIGAVAGVVCIYAIDLLEWLRIDDPIGAFPVHGACGIWGTLSLGLFACGKYGAPGPMGADDSAGSVLTGLFYGGGSNVLISQLIGNGSIAVATFGVSLLMMYAVKFTGTLRVSKDGELEGLDVHEHGGSAYPGATRRWVGHSSRARGPGSTRRRLDLRGDGRVGKYGCS